MKVRLGFTVVVMCLLVLACSTGEKGVTAGMTAGVAWADLSLDEAKVEAANQNKLIMVDVFSPT